MIDLYALNYLIFAVFLTLFMMETGIALIALLSYKVYNEKIKRYISTMWEIDITFAVFYLVNFEVVYPGLLAIGGTIYIVPAIAAALFLIVRNIFIAYSNYSGKRENEHRYVVIYSLATLLIAFFALSALTSSVTGTGINLASSTINLAVIFINPYNVLMLISVLLLCIFLATMFFGSVRFTKRMYLILIAAFGLFLIATKVFTPYIFSNLLAMPYLLLISLILLGMTIFAKVRESKLAGPLSLLWIFVSINFFGELEYPYMFGRAVDVTKFMASQTIAGPAAIISLVGSFLVGLALLYLILLSREKKTGQNY